jgi:hypothetical protein
MRRICHSLLWKVHRLQFQLNKANEFDFEHETLLKLLERPVERQYMVDLLQDRFKSGER